MPIVRVREVVKETSDAHTLVLESRDGERLDYVAGQFLTVRIPSERPEGAARCYSLCTAPDHDEFPAVTVKRTAGGYASNWLCDHAGVGTELEVLAPSGIFTPSSLSDDVLLLAGGSGITPVMSILKTVLHSGTGSVVLLYGNRDEHSVIFAEQLRELVAAFPDRLRVVHWLESVQGLPSQASLGGLLRGFWDDERARGVRVRAHAVHGPGRAHPGRARRARAPGARGAVHLAAPATRSRRPPRSTRPARPARSR